MNWPIFFMILVILIIGFCIGSFATASGTASIAIKNNCAHYDSKTGDFTWNNEVKK